ncbi:uncharacterized protein LOC115220334 [Argonauta hians]
MTEHRYSKEEFSSNGSDDSLISAELNNNISPYFSNEDLISLGFDSPPPHKPDFTFHCSVVAPREAAGESKSDLNDILLDPFTTDDQQYNYGSKDIHSAGFPFNDSDNLNQNNNQQSFTSYPGLIPHDTQTLPFTTDGTPLPATFETHQYDEDIRTRLSVMHFPNDSSEDKPVMSPDSGRPDSPKMHKTSSYDTLKILQKRDTPSPTSNLSNDMSEDESSTVYLDVKTDDDEPATFHDLSEISMELGDKFQKSNYSDNFESADSSCKTSNSSFDMGNETDQDTDSLPKPVRNTWNSSANLKSGETKSLPRDFARDMTKSMPEESLSRTLKRNTIDARLLRSVNEQTLPSRMAAPSAGGNQEKFGLSKGLFSSSYNQDRKSNNKSRREDKPFRVEVLKGILGFGMDLHIDDNGFAKVTDIKKQSPIGKNGNIKVGDYILSINDTDLLNVTESRVQQILRVLPRGLITVVASVTPVADWKQHFTDADKFTSDYSSDRNGGISLTTPVKISSLSNFGSLSKTEPNGRMFGLNKSTPGAGSSNINTTKNSTFGFYKQPNGGSDRSLGTLEINPTLAVKQAVFLDRTDNKESQKISEQKSNNTQNFSGVFGTNTHDKPNSSAQICSNHNNNSSRSSSKDSSYISSSSSSNDSRSFISFKEDNSKLLEPVKSNNFPKFHQEKRSLPDILQDHTEPIKRQYIAKSHNSLAQSSRNRDTSSMGFHEEKIVPMKSPRKKIYNAPPDSENMKAFKFLPKKGDMDSFDSKEERDRMMWVKKPIKKATKPSGVLAKEDLIIPMKAKSVRCLVDRYNSPPQNNKESKRIEIKTCIGVTEKIRAVNMKTAESSLSKPSVMVEEMIQPVYKPRFTPNNNLPRNVNYNSLAMDDVLVIEQTEQPNSKPDVKMTLTSSFLPETKIVEPVIEPLQKSNIFARPKPAPRLRSPLKTIQCQDQRKDPNMMDVDKSHSEIFTGNNLEDLSPDISNIQKSPTKPEIVESTLLNTIQTGDYLSPNMNRIDEENIVPVVKKRRYSMNIPKVCKMYSTNMDDIVDDIGKMGVDRLATRKASYDINLLREIFEEERIVPEIKPRRRSLSPLLRTKDSDKSSEETTVGLWQCNTKLNPSEEKPGRTVSEVEEGVLEATHKDLAHSAPGSVLDVKKEHIILEKYFDSLKKENLTSFPHNNNNINYTLDNNNLVGENLVSASAPMVSGPTLVSPTSPHNPLNTFNFQKRSLPIIENGKPKPLPRRTRSPLFENDPNMPEEIPRSKRRMLPTLRSPVTSPNEDQLKITAFENRLADPDNYNSVSAPASPSRARKVVTSVYRELNPALSLERRNSTNFIFPVSNQSTYRSQPLQKYNIEQSKNDGRTSPDFKSKFDPSCSAINEKKDSLSRNLPKTPHFVENLNLSRSLPSVPLPEEINHRNYSPDTIIEEQRTITRSLPILPNRPEDQVEPTFKTVKQTSIVRQTAVSESIPLTIKLQDSPLKSKSNSSSPDVSPLITLPSHSTDSTRAASPKRQIPILPEAKNDIHYSSPKMAFHRNSEFIKSEQVPVNSSTPMSKTPDVAEIKDNGGTGLLVDFTTIADNSSSSSNNNNNKDTPFSELISNTTNIAVASLDDDDAAKEIEQIPVISSDAPESPIRNLAGTLCNIMNIPVKTETDTGKSDTKTDSTTVLSPIKSSIDFTETPMLASVETVQPEESVTCFTMPASFSTPNIPEPESRSNIEEPIPPRTPSNDSVSRSNVESPISPRITSNRKLPDIFKSSPHKTSPVGKNTSPSKPDILFTDFAPKPALAVSTRVESKINIETPKEDVLVSPKAEIAVSIPVMLQPKITKDLPQSTPQIDNLNSSPVTTPMDDLTSSNKFPEKSDTTQLKLNDIPKNTSPIRKSLASLTEVDSSKSVPENGTNNDIKSSLYSERRKKLAEYKRGISLNSDQSSSTKDDTTVVMRRSRELPHFSPSRNPSRSSISDRTSMSPQAPLVTHRSSRKMSLQQRKEIAKTCLDTHTVFSKRKWCISTRFGQTNFAIPTEPESAEAVLKLALLDEDTVIDLVNKANFALDKLGLSAHYSIHICILEKEATEKIGMRLQKGDKQELLISLLECDGAAARHNYICEGDLFLYMDGKPVWNQTVMDIKMWLQTTATRATLLLARPFVAEESEVFEIRLYKGVTGLGFSLVGGVGCPLGDRPISVKRIFKGGSADRSSEIRVGDEILEVNGTDFRNQRHFNAWNHLKFLPEGELTLLIRRHRSNEKTSPAPIKATTTPASPDAALSQASSSAATTEVKESSSLATTVSEDPRNPQMTNTPNEASNSKVRSSPERGSAGIAAGASMIAMSMIGAVTGMPAQDKPTTDNTSPINGK